MRYTPEHKEKARSRLVELGGRHAKQHGFDGSAMADLAAAAGVTTGSLYKHFGNKSELFVALITAELERTAKLYSDIDPADPLQWSCAHKGYLSLTHVRQPAAGCPLPSLTAEVGRADDNVKEAYEAGIQAIHERVEALTENSEVAWAVIAQSVGAVMLARAMRSERLQSELLSAVLHAGEKLIPKTHASKKRNSL